MQLKRVKVDIDKEYKSALNRFRVGLSRAINNKINKQVEKDVYPLMLEARSKVQGFILATPMTYVLGSERAIADLANRVIIKKSTSYKLNSYKLSIRDLKPNNDFAMFLEYGTGYLGERYKRRHTQKMSEENKKPENMWKYMVNGHKHYITHPAFMFDAKKDSFVTDTDKYPMVLFQKRKIKDVSTRTRNGETTTYVRTAKVKQTGVNGKIVRKNGYAYYPSKPDYSKVLSFGIKPVRYMYRTREWLKEKLKKPRSKSIVKE